MNFENTTIVHKEEEMTATGLEPLMSSKQLAAYLGVSVETIYYWRTCNKAPPAVHVAGTLRWRESDVREWLNRDSESEK